MRNSVISAMAVGLALGLVTPAVAGDWTGVHLTFGLSNASTNMGATAGSAVFPNGGVSDHAPFAGIGYDKAFGNLTFGLVADVDLTGVDSYDDMVSSGKGFYGESDWFATFRGRVGVPVNDDLHIFASGGLAVMKARGTAAVKLGPAVSDTDYLKGAAVGLGMEYSVTPTGHLTVEYLYADFEGSDLLGLPNASAGRLDPTVSTLRIGYTLRF